ncbi:MAG: transcription-repair coupling factor [Chloroflexi bacterium]|mgnify:CR=1 FL=1|nr:transcription-repair coupling factor [Chloroflexota bacterium]
MDLARLVNLLCEDAHYQALTAQLRAHAQQPGALGILEAARPWVIGALQRDWQGLLVVISPTPDTARALATQLASWLVPESSILYLPPPDVLFYDAAPWDRDTQCQRAGVLAQVAEYTHSEPAQPTVLVSSVWALMPRSVPASAFRRAMRILEPGQRLMPRDLLEQLVRLGYEYAPVVESPGTFSHRGSIVDLYSPQHTQPLRIDFWGDEIDTLRWFDPVSQRSGETAILPSITPASEALPQYGPTAAQTLERLDLSGMQPSQRQRLREEITALQESRNPSGLVRFLPMLYPQPGNILGLLPESSLVLADDLAACRNAALVLEEQARALQTDMLAEGELPEGWPKPYFEWRQLTAQLEEHRTYDLGYGETEALPILGERSFIAVPQFAGQLRFALADIAELARSQRVVIVTRQSERLEDLLREQELAPQRVEAVPEVLPEHGVLLMDGILSEGVAYTPGALVLLTDAEIFGWVRPPRRRTQLERTISPDTFYSDLRPGDYVVHLEHGVARFHGLVHKSMGGLEREYLELEYAAGDRLFVPVHQAERVGRYIGPDDKEPTLQRLSSHDWEAARQRAQRAVRDIAMELLELYATRAIVPGHAFGEDTPWQRELESSFPYEETPDQLRALSDIKADMESSRPMDRLLCGDVGYGKTEVALRAAFKAVMDGKQVAVLVPTTVLAQQHFYTFRRRLRAFPVTVEMLSRFRSPAEQDEIVRKLAEGFLDIVIGTHRLLSGDVAFRNLGLLVIDEEQRFGVSHKETLKKMRSEVDVLTLTATPIPRTLYLALSGARDMSLIDTPPEDRLPVRTTVSAYDPALVRKAILRELDRGGQVFYVHNRVQGIYAVADQLQELVPEASFVVGHGQMAENELAQVMLGFANGEANVLVCTTIIESGLDIPNVNTIIIDHADTFGLAQLYQLRGRVGRGTNRAYAYLFYDGTLPLSEIARRRLQTIQEATELGAGFRVAMQDMEIRGAGEVLGAEQHGHIAAIGYDLYVRLLQSAVQELKESSGDSVEAIRRAQRRLSTHLLTLEVGPTIDLPLSAYVPPSYLADNTLRLRFYRRLARAESLEEIEALEHEVTDRYGSLPEPVANLLYILRIRSLAAQCGINTISVEDQQIAMALPQTLLSSLARKLSSQFDGVTARGGRIWLAMREGWPAALEELLRTLSENPAYLALVSPPRA